MAYEDDRPYLLCESCGQVDQAPRHVYSQAPGDAETPAEVAEKALQAAGDHFAEVLAQIRDDSVTYKHMDCCAADGCPDGTCNEIVAAAKGKQNEALVKFITSQGD